MCTHLQAWPPREIPQKPSSERGVHSSRSKTHKSPFRQPNRTGKYGRCAWERPPYGNPPLEPKNDVGETLPGPSRPFLRLVKVTQKRGFCQWFPGGLPAVLPRFGRRSPGGFPAVFRQFCQWSPGSFPAFLPAVRQRFDAGFPAFSSGFASGLPAVLPAVFQQFSSSFPGVSTGVFRQFSGSFPATRFPWIKPNRLRRTSSSERNRWQIRTHSQAYKPSIAAFSKVCL